ncbi:putative peptidoglycan lipid II flippase [Elusimicrobium simillimum]|uniref:lipid II flippase MurJ n=1 Tax=Elusimicrobium simillimum TaxID=3143438 RepID=UPI003C6EE974
MKRVFNEYSYKKGAAVSVASTALWKLVSFANSILIAFWFGTSYGADLYFYLIILAGIFTQVFLSLNTNNIIPQAMHLGAGDKQGEIKFLNCFIVFYMVFGVLLCLAGAAAPAMWLGLLSRFDYGGMAARALFCLALVYFALYILTQFLINILERHKVFGIAYFYPLNAIMPFIFLVVLHDKIGIAGMLCGFIAALAIQAIICLAVMFGKLGWKVEFAGAGFTKQFWHNTLASLGAEAVQVLTSFIPVFFMSGYAAGIVSAYNYSKQVTDSPTEIITNRVVNVAKINFNDLAAKGDNAGLAKSFYKTLLILLLIMSPIAVFTGLFAQDIIRLFFERGSFSAADTKNTALFVTLFMPNIILLLPSFLHRALASAARKLKEFFIYQIISMAVFLLAIFVCMGRMEAYGYPVAFIISNIFWLGFAFMFMKRHFNFISHGRTLRILFQVAFLACAAVIPSLLIERFFSVLIVRIFICGALYVTLFALLARAAYIKIWRKLCH